jgi:hypothetical protein
MFTKEACMKKLVFLIAALALMTACWDNNGHWDSRYYTLTLRVGTCRHAPFRIYIDGKESHDKVAEIDAVGGSVLIVLQEGWHNVYVRDDMGDWIYEDDVHMDNDRDIQVDC